MSIEHLIVGGCAILFGLLIVQIISMAFRLNKLVFFVEVLVSGLLFLEAAFLFLGEVVWGLVFLVIIIFISVVAFLGAKSFYSSKRP